MSLSIKPGQNPDPFAFKDSEFWKDASKKLCVDGWPQVVVTLNVAMRDMKDAHTQSQVQIEELRRKLIRYERLANYCSEIFTDLNHPLLAETVDARIADINKLKPLGGPDESEG